MPGHTLVGFTESVDSSTLQAATPLADQHVTVRGDLVVVPDWSKLVATYVLGPNPSRARIVAPSLRDFGYPNLSPFDNNALPADRSPVNFFLENPMGLLAGEDLEADFAEDGAGATRVTILLWLAKEAVKAVMPSDFRTIRATGTATLTANVWSNASITLDDPLKPGKYAIIGARGESTNLQAFRFVPRLNPYGFNNRPGAVGYAGDQLAENREFRNGRMGEWCQFFHNEVPTVDYLANGADTAQTVYIDVMRL